MHIKMFEEELTTDKRLWVTQEKCGLYTCQDGTRVYTVVTHLDYIYLKLELF